MSTLVWEQRDHHRTVVGRMRTKQDVVNRFADSRFVFEMLDELTDRRQLRGGGNQGRLRAMLHQHPNSLSLIVLPGHKREIHCNLRGAGRSSQFLGTVA